MVIRLTDPRLIHDGRIILDNDAFCRDLSFRGSARRNRNRRIEWIDRKNRIPRRGTSIQAMKTGFPSGRSFRRTRIRRARGTVDSSA